MLFETQKAFPYPVLRSEIDDYLDGGFQASVHFEISGEGDKITASVDILHSVEELQALIGAGRAEYVVMFECKDTFLRRAHHSRSTAFDVEFTSGALRGEVTVSPFIVAKEKSLTSPARSSTPNLELGLLSSPREVSSPWTPRRAFL